MNLLIGISLLFGYIIGMSIRYKTIFSSISSTVYYLKNPCKIAWTIVVCATVFLIAPSLIGAFTGISQILAFFTAAGLLFVGGAPLVPNKTELSYKIHCGGAIFCAISSQILVAIEMPILLLMWIPIILVKLYFVVKKKEWKTMVFFSELVCFISTFILCFKALLY